MKTKVLFLILPVFIACILPTHSAAHSFQQKNNFLSKYTSLSEDEFDLDVTRFSPCVKGIASKVCIIDSKISELSGDIASCCEATDASIDSCCSQIESHLEVIETKINNLSPGAIVSCCDRIEDTIASCCAATDISIDSCCSQIESHLEVIETKINNLSPGAIVSCCDRIEDTIASCCAATDVSIDSCCSQIESHLEVIETKINNLSPGAIVSCCDRIEDTIASCCAATDVSIDSCCSQIESHLEVIETKINNLSPGAIVSCCDRIEDTIASCCAATDVSIDSCCSQIESHLEVIETKINNLSPGAIVSCCDHIENVVASCCADIENAVSSCCAATDASIDSCCSQLSGDIASCCAEINTNLESCCEELASTLSVIESKIDTITASGAIVSCCDHIENVVASCCADIENTVASCCAATDAAIASCCEATDASINSCCTQLSGDIASCCEQTEASIASCCDRLSSELQSCCEELQSCCEAIHDKLPCPAIPVTGPGLLSTYGNFSSGTYCLTQDITGPLIIDTSSIILEMNGHRADGLVITATQDVIIRNGNVVGTGSGIGIEVDSVSSYSNMRFEHLTLENFEYGLSAANVNNLELEDILTSGNIITGAVIASSVNVDVHACTFKDSSSACLVITDSSMNVSVMDCIFRQSASFDEKMPIFGFAAISSSCITVKNCIANSSVPTNNGGFIFFDSTGVNIEQCFSCGFGVGFFANVDSAATSTLDIFVSQCTAEDNTIAGFGWSSENGAVYPIYIHTVQCSAIGNRGDNAIGFVAQGNLVHTLYRDCKATNNDIGFDTNSTNNQYYNNIACDNDVNYGALIVSNQDARVTSPNNARGVMNVDCASSDADQIDQIQSCCEAVNSKIDAACGATAIHQSDVNMDPVNGYVITQPGHYCCAENLVGGTDAIITISASDVTLDLNGYELRASNMTSQGIVIDSSVTHTGIVIRNGFIRNDGPGDAMPPFYFGISVGNPLDETTALQSDIGIYDITVQSFEGGILVSRCQNVVIENYRTEETTFGLGILNTNGARVLRSNFLNNAGFGIAVSQIEAMYGPMGEPPANVHIEQCVFEEEQAIAAVFFNNAQCCKVVNCSAHNQGTAQLGYVTIGQSTGIIFKDCRSCDFINGFDLDGAGNLLLDGCVAQNNGNGFDIHTTTTVGSLIKECSALNNTGFGFRETSIAQNLYENNTSCGNGTNYDTSITSAPVTSPANARGVHNVDCANSDVDQIDEIQSCCEIVDSKVDLLLQCGRHYITDFTGIAFLSTFSGAGSASSSGEYCLTQDIADGALIIDIPHVQVNLNGHVIKNMTTAVFPELAGIVVLNGVYDVTIYNGALEGPNLSLDDCIYSGFPPASIGIALVQTATTFETPKDIKIHNLEIKDWCNGLLAFNADSIEVNDTNFINNALYGALIFGSNSGVRFHRCIFQQQSGEAMHTDKLTHGLELIDCVATNSGTAAFGFRLVDTQALVKDCGAYNFLDSGIEAHGGASVYNCTTKQNNIGIKVTGQNIDIQNCTSSNNLMAGLFVEGGDSIHIENSFFHVDLDSLSTTTPRAVWIEQGSCINIFNCSAGIRAGITGPMLDATAGFYVADIDPDVEDIKHINFRDCFACGFGSGFQIIDASDVSIVGCDSQGNSVAGYDIALTDLTPTISAAIIKHCIAKGNGIGFNDTSVIANLYENNNACNNNTNYSASIIANAFARVTSPNNARGVMNVDCSNTDPDQVDALESCCQVLDSKLDVCCEQVNSKLDFIIGLLGVPPGG